MADVVWLEPEERCDVSVRIVPHRIQDDELPAAAESAEVVLHCSSELLSRIPYFASSLSEPWQASCKEGAPREITLVCTTPTMCPADYLQCLQFLKPEGIKLPWTVNTTLKVLRVADYMDYKDCAEVCMKYLASMPWCSTDESAVRDAFATMGMVPSPDVCARLERIKNGQEFFKEILILHAEKAVSDARETDHWIGKLVKFLERGVKFVDVRGALLEAWVEVTEDIITKGEVSKVDLWVILTRVSVVQGDEGAMLNAFMERCEKFCSAAMRSEILKDTYGEANRNFGVCLAAMVEGVIPGRRQGQGIKPSMLLSNAKRAWLAAALTPMAEELDLYHLKEAINQLLLTLPLHHPMLTKLMKQHKSIAFFSYGNNADIWYERFFLAMDQAEDFAAPAPPAPPNI